jgi:dipeptidyl aminopeptidase/acylaminoacyl peptidase
MRTSIFALLLACAPAATRVENEPVAATERSAQQITRDEALVPRATAYLSAYSNSSPHLLASGTVVFISNRDGLSQLYAGDSAHPKEPARKLPTPNERVAGAVVTTDEKTILFASDVGADGNFHLFRVGVDGAGLADLTPGEKLHRDPPRVARDEPSLFAYAAHAPSSERTRLFVQRLDGSAPREFFADDRGGSLADLSPDGTRALYERRNSHQDVVLFEVEVKTGKSTRLYPPEGQPAQLTASYSADGQRVFVATQLEGRNAELLAIDRRTGKALARYEEATVAEGSLAGALVSPRGDWIAIDVNGGNRFELRILDASTLQLRRTLATPLGVAATSDVTKDGRKIALTLSNPESPTDVFVADPATGEVKPLREDERPGLSQLTKMRVSIEIVKSSDGLAIPTNLYLPEARPKEKLPVLVSIHGGPSSSAAIRWNPALLFYLSLGYAIVEPNIRGSTGFGVAFEKADNKEKRIGALNDVEAVNRWARAQPWCDPDRIAIMGVSYGGYMTLLATARQPKLWSAGLDGSGMSDLRTMEKLEDQAIRVYDETEFGVLGKEDDLLFDWSPLKYVDAIAAPLFVYQGVNDPITPQNEADQIVRALRMRKVPVEYMLIANEGHGFSRRENYAQYLARTARFLEEHAAGR